MVLLTAGKDYTLFLITALIGLTCANNCYIYDYFYDDLVLPQYCDATKYNVLSFCAESRFSDGSITILDLFLILIMKFYQQNLVESIIAKRQESSSSR